MSSSFPARLAAMEPFWGTWYLDELLGEGSYGKVYRIRRKEFDRVYYAALKWVPVPQNELEPQRQVRGGADEASVRAYYRDIVTLLQNELIMMSALRGNSHVVSYEDHAIVERQDAIGYDVLMRMELLTPLPDLTGKSMQVKDVVTLGLHLCSALMLCEKANIVHRDIKPDNIFQSEFGNFKLGDFGVARQLEQTQGAMSRKGTPHYMAPELMVGGTSGRSVDQYSLGLVLHNLLNGNRIPFVDVSSRLPTASERDEAYRRRMMGEALPPPILGSEQLKQVVCKAAAYRAEDRYPDAKALRDALVQCHADLEDDTPLNTALVMGGGLKPGNDEGPGHKRVPDTSEAATEAGGLTEGLMGTEPRRDRRGPTQAHDPSEDATIGEPSAAPGHAPPRPAAPPPKAAPGPLAPPPGAGATTTTQDKSSRFKRLMLLVGGALAVLVGVMVVLLNQPAAPPEPTQTARPTPTARLTDQPTAVPTEKPTAKPTPMPAPTALPDVRSMLAFSSGFLRYDKDSGNPSTLYTDDVSLGDLNGNAHYWHAVRITNPGGVTVDFKLTYRINEGPIEVFGDRSLNTQQAVNYYLDSALHAGTSTITWYVNGYEATSFTGTVREPATKPTAKATAKPTAEPTAKPTAKSTAKPVPKLSGLQMSASSATSLSFRWNNSISGSHAYTVELTSGKNPVKRLTTESTTASFKELVPNAPYTIKVSVKDGNTISITARTKEASPYRDYTFRWKSGTLISLPHENDYDDNTGRRTHKETKAQDIYNNMRSRFYYFHLDFTYHQQTSFDKTIDQILVVRLPDDSVVFNLDYARDVNGKWKNVWWRFGINNLFDEIISAHGSMPRGKYYLEAYFDGQFAGRGSFEVK